MARKPREKNWRAYRMRGKGVVELGTVTARNEEEAVRKAIEEFEIPRALHNRVLVRPEE